MDKLDLVHNNGFVVTTEAKKEEEVTIMIMDTSLTGYCP